MSRVSPDVPGTWEHGEPPRPRLVPFTPRERQEARTVDEMYGSRMQEAQRFALGNCTVFVVREPAGKDGDWLWHMSMSHPKRHPTWDEIKAARYWLLSPDLTFGMLLPPPAQYVNVVAQDHTFHLWEVTDPRDSSARE